LFEEFFLCGLPKPILSSPDFLEQAIMKNQVLYPIF